MDTECPTGGRIYHQVSTDTSDPNLGPEIPAYPCAPRSEWAAYEFTPRQTALNGPLTSVAGRAPAIESRCTA